MKLFKAFIVITSFLTLANQSHAESPVLDDKELEKHINENIDNGKYQSIILARINDQGTSIYTYGELIDGNGLQPTKDTFF
ncbi:hypothetical protein [Pseudemcibacter aquimaris]|uniref:hypothetical protein n=1 Tax=Pseudemcibacter aquimaris TaxID=2857064 RepID=UPI002011B73F|nr:hypothetical protein [Pseudemcibacter aquimaris]MCC3861064.1 hypothetical protein [Pseudemcibacter aquimaris]WDU59882.1 hypothetical protein KW060_06390 [Pseudemcibacter aquimaris]